MSRRRTSAWALVAAVAVASTTLVGVATVPTTAASAPRAAETTLSIRVPHPKIEAGETTRIRGGLHVRGPEEPSGRTVTLEARPQGATDFAPIGTAVAGPRGGLRLEVQPTTTTRYRWTFAGDEDTRPSRSGIARVVIVADQHDGHRLNTSLSIRAAHRLVGADGSGLVRGRLRTHGIGLRHRVVDLQVRTAGQPAWQVIGQVRSDHAGGVGFVVHPTERTAYRLVFEGSRVFRPSHSAIVRIGVRPVVTASASPDWINPGETTTVSGVATMAGQPLSGASVDLVARTAGHSGPRHVVGSGTTAADGTVAISDTPAESTVYRLVVRQSAGVPRGASEAVRVMVRAPSSLSIRGRHVADGFVVSGILRGNHHTVRNATVDLEMLGTDGTTWAVVASDTTGRRGKVSLLAPNAEGASFRLSYAGSTRLAPCVSGTVVS